ncbi:MAG: hypothetical protein LBK74_01905 [Treponema sp.]|jgi:hypothetical protein|nr:hypothetical protein [Treponema sp.]
MAIYTNFRIGSGLEKGLAESVKNLTDFGMNPEQISRALKLPLDVVQRCLK